MLYRHVREKLDRHFGLNQTTNNFPIGSMYRNIDFRLSPILTYAVWACTGKLGRHLGPNIYSVVVKHPLTVAQICTLRGQIFSHWGLNIHPLAVKYPLIWVQMFNPWWLNILSLRVKYPTPEVQIFTQLEAKNLLTGVKCPTAGVKYSPTEGQLSTPCG